MVGLSKYGSIYNNSIFVPHVLCGRSEDDELAHARSSEEEENEIVLSEERCHGNEY